MIGSHKRDKGCAPHYVFFRGLWRIGWLSDCEFLEYGWHFKSREATEAYNELLRRIYAFIWKLQPKPIFETQEDEKKPEVLKLEKNTTSGEKRKCDFFNLPEFLKQTDHIPNNQEYKQIISYLASINYSVDEAERLCNAAWQPDLKETRRLLQNQSFRGVTKGSVIRYLLLHCIEPDFSQIWLTPQLQFYNGYKVFCQPKLICNRVEIEDFLIDTVQYVYSVKKFT